MTYYPVCGTHWRAVPADCDCPVTTRATLIARGIIRPGPDLSYLPWLDVPTFRLEREAQS